MAAAESWPRPFIVTHIAAESIVSASHLRPFGVATTILGCFTPDLALSALLACSGEVAYKMAPVDALALGATREGAYQKKTCATIAGVPVSPLAQ
jgi:hypothetical protein